MLVLRPGALGDTLLAVPALRALRRHFAPLTLAAHGPTARLLSLLGEVDRGMSFDDPSLGWLFGDAVPDEPVVAWMSAEAASALRHAAVVAPARPQTNEHCARYLLRTLTPLDIELSWDDRPVQVTPIHSDEVLIHPGSGSPAKNWPAARFAALMQALDTPARLVIGEADTAAAVEVETLVGRAVPRLEQPPLEELAGRLAGCRAYVGNDSGVSHLAGLCGARTIVLFGPTSPDIWRPIGPDVHVEDFQTSPEAIAAAV